MADLVNLRNYRKQVAKETRQKQAGQNRLVHGMTSEQKKAIDAQKRKNEKHLDGHRLDETLIATCK